MDVDKMNPWLTLVANVGVVGGLIFLGVEIQQNTNAVRASALQESTNVARQQLLTIASDPDISRISNADYEQLSDNEKLRRLAFARSFWLGMHNLFRQWEMGVLSDKDWTIWYGIICRNRSRSDSEIWSRQSDLSREFLDTVGNCPTAP